MVVVPAAAAMEVVPTAVVKVLLVVMTVVTKCK
jgi:hypothetical protein